MGGRTQLITEYRQTGGDADGDSIVGMVLVWGRIENILPCHPLVHCSTVISALCSRWSNCCRELVGVRRTGISQSSVIIVAVCFVCVDPGLVLSVVIIIVVVFNPRSSRFGERHYVSAEVIEKYTSEHCICLSHIVPVASHRAAASYY